MNWIKWAVSAYFSVLTMLGAIGSMFTTVASRVTDMRRRLAGSLREPRPSVLVPVFTCHQQTKLDRHWNRVTRRCEPTLFLPLWSAPTVSLVSVEIMLFWESRRRLGRTVAFNKGSIGPWCLQWILLLPHPPLIIYLRRKTHRVQCAAFWIQLAELEQITLNSCKSSKFSASFQ